MDILYSRTYEILFIQRGARASRKLALNYSKGEQSAQGSNRVYTLYIFGPGKK